MANGTLVIQFVGVLLVCHAVIGRPTEMESDESATSSDSSSDEGEYNVDAHNVASVVSRMRGRLLAMAERAKESVAEKQSEQVKSKNIIDPPVNCPDGWMMGPDGECHPDFDAELGSMRLEDRPSGANVVDPPPNCPEGWLPGEDGECHPIFESGRPSQPIKTPADERSGTGKPSGGDNVVDPPPNCPEGWLPGEDGECHPIFEVAAPKHADDGEESRPNCWPSEDGKC